MPDYDFRTLSPSDFELLVRDLLVAEHGWRLEAFGHGRDGGVDLRGWVNGKKLVVQCKHYIGSTFADLRKSALLELPKMDKERPDRYLFVTSQKLSRTQKDTLAEDLSKWLANPADLLTQLDINELLGMHFKVERQHFKLWLASTEVLERIVHNGLWERSEALMEDISDRVKLYVRSPAYERAAKILDAHNVVVLTGAPGVGKSMLSEMLCLSHWHEDWQVVSLSSNISEGWDAYRRNVRQIFIYDDFLGQTDISERANKNEDAQIVRFMDRVSKDSTKRLVMTTRSQILRQASLKREPLARGGFKVRECLVEIADYGTVERARILYNHLYFSQLPRSVLRDYVNGKHYWHVVNHKNFSPRVIEQVLRREHLGAQSLARDLANALDRPIELWGTMFASVLSPVAQRIVLGLVTFPPEGVQAESLRRMVRGDAGPIEYTQALRTLEGTFVSIESSHIRDFGPTVSYANPSVRDFALATLDEEVDYLFSILDEVRTVKQIRIILDYAASTVDNGFKFPKLARSVSENQHFIAELITSLVAHIIQQGNAKQHPEQHVMFNALLPLAGLLGAAHRLMPATIKGLLGTTMALHRKYADWHLDASALETLTRTFVAHEASRDQSFTEDLRVLISSWGFSLEDLDEIRAFRDFARTCKHDLRLDWNLDTLVEECIEKALRAEIETMTNNRHDEEADITWLEEIESLAHEMELGERLSRNIEYERSNTAEYYAERDYDDSPSPKWQAERSALEPPASSDNSYVNDIFRHMS